VTLTEFDISPRRIWDAHSRRIDRIKAQVAELRAKGVALELYDLPGVEFENRIMHIGPEVWRAWFKDPDGNVIGLSQIG